MNIIEKIKTRAKENRKTIVLPESDDLRVLEAVGIIGKENFADVILIGDETTILNLAKEHQLDVSYAKIIDPKTYNKTDELIESFYELRKHKGMTLEKAKDLMLHDYPYFACMLVKLGYADGVVSGAVHSSADTLRAALQVIKASPEAKIVSSFFLMDVPNCSYGADGVFVYADCGMIQNPTSEELALIANSSAKTFQLLVEKEPIIAFLSHSTYGSSKCPDVDKVQKAVELAKEQFPDLLLDGELQFDAAIIPEIAATKAPGSKIAGHANTLIFPDLDAGNIGYKITERLAKAKAYGPITQGIAKPINDLSRGCNATDIVGAVAITALQANQK